MHALLAGHSMRCRGLRHTASTSAHSLPRCTAALASADVGIAMGGGTDVAGDAASVVLMGDRLGQLWEALELGRATMSKIRQNLGWAGALGAGGGWASGCEQACDAAPAHATVHAVAYNFVGVPVAAGALLPSHGLALSPSMAGGFMALSSIAVVGNSLLLRHAIARGSDAAGATAARQQQQRPSPAGLL